MVYGPSIKAPAVLPWVQDFLHAATYIYTCALKEVTWIQPGASAASKALAQFCKESVLAGYIHRNDPLTCKRLA